MTLVEVVNIQTVESGLLLLVQARVEIVVLRTDAGVVHILILAIGYEQYVVNKRVNAILNPPITLRQRLLLEICLNLTLCVKLGLHSVDIVVAVLQECSLHKLRLLAEVLTQHILVDEGLGHKLLLEVQAIRANLLGRHRHSG